MNILNDRLLREKEVCSIAGVSRVTIWRWEKEGLFPKRHKLYGSITVWKYSDVMNWFTNVTAIAA